MNNKLETNAFFHEEAHIYFPTQEEHDKFAKSFEKNPEWAIRNKTRWNAIPSITQLLGKIFPFSGGDLKITKAWYKKEMGYIGQEQDKTDKVLKVMEHVEQSLEKSVKRSQEEGTQGHEFIQDFIEFKKESESGINKYYDAFIKKYEADTWLGEFVDNIDVILPSEIPIIGKINEKGMHYAGKWDLLVQLKDGRTALIDIKTGSPVKYDKLEKVGLQLNAYKELVKQSLDVNVDIMICWEVSYNVNDDYSRDYYVKQHEIEHSNKFFKLAENEIWKQRIMKGK